MSSSSPTSIKIPKSEVKDEENNDDEQVDCCGICYIERGVSIPGEIDCCNHYFCFVCIMEWAKHESRCPICRQRFSNVRRLPKLGLFDSSRDVKVPIRDQVYHPHGNVTSGPVNSYAELKCCICHVGTDEYLILICDLCDTASHTYCVGLGYTVPEGDWFCHDCAVSRETNANDVSDQQNVELTAEPGVTISSIVRETDSQLFRRPKASAIRQNQSLSSVIPLLDRMSGPDGKKPLSERQRAQQFCQALRENWNSLRSGSLKFPGKSFQSGGSSSQKQDSRSASRGKDAKPSNMSNNGGLKDDVDKAWKMMDKAKKMQQTTRKTSRVPQGVDSKPSSCSGAREIPCASRSGLELKNQQPRTSDFRNTRMEKQCDYSSSSINKNLEKHQSPILGEKRKSRASGEMIQHLRDHTTHSEGYRERPLPRKVRTSTNGAPCHEERNAAKEQRQTACSVTLVGSAPSIGKSSSVFNSAPCHEERNAAKEQRQTACSVTLVGSAPSIGKSGSVFNSAPCHEERNAAKEQRQTACSVTLVGSAPSIGKSGSVFTSNKDLDIFNKEKRLANSSRNGIVKNTEDAKTEIRTLVKQNLKCLTRDKKLGVETFKIVARKSTHTILAACLSELQESNIHSSTPVCSHSDHILQNQKSNLMPNCCQECFHVFVSNVIKSILLEKVGCCS